MICPSSLGPPRANQPSGSHQQLIPGCRVEEEEALHERNVLAALYCPALDALITSAEEGSIRIHWLNMRWG